MSMWMRYCCKKIHIYAKTFRLGTQYEALRPSFGGESSWEEFQTITLPLLAVAELTNTGTSTTTTPPHVHMRLLTILVTWALEQAVFCEASAPALEGEAEKQRVPLEETVAKRRRAEALPSDNCLSLVLPTAKWSLCTQDGPFIQASVKDVEFFRSINRNRCALHAVACVASIKVR